MVSQDTSLQALLNDLPNVVFIDGEYSGKFWMCIRRFSDRWRVVYERRHREETTDIRLEANEPTLFGAAEEMHRMIAEAENVTPGALALDGSYVEGESKWMCWVDGEKQEHDTNPVYCAQLIQRAGCPDVNEYLLEALDEDGLPQRYYDPRGQIGDEKVDLRKDSIFRVTLQPSASAP